MNDMEISCFLSVARTGSFTVSARELSSTQQAVSRNIQSLESELGFPLLNRGGSSVTLTWAGRRFLQWRVEHDAQLSELERQCRRMSAVGADELFVAWNDWTGCPRGIPEDLRSFRLTYPGVRLHVLQGTTEDVAGMLRDGTADIAILPDISVHNLKGLTISPPFAEQQLYVVSRDLEEMDMEALSSMRYLAAAMGEQDEESVRRRVRMFCAEIGISPNQLEILPNARSTFTQLLCGGCYTIAPGGEVMTGLRTIPLEGCRMRLVFVTPQGRVNGPWVSLFESFVRQRRSQI